MSSFTEKLDEESLKFFNDLCQQPFSRQGVAFLNAYWDEIGDQADFVYSVAWEVIQARFILNIQTNLSHSEQYLDALSAILCLVC